MEVRDGVESDADAVAALTGLPVDAARQLLRDRTVRVAERDDRVGDSDRDEGDGSPARDEGGRGGHAAAGHGGDARVEGVVAFSASPGTVHVTQLAGATGPVERLLEEPVRFARAEGMTVEIVIPDDAPECPVLETAGFEDTGAGPIFDGDPTRRYRLQVGTE
ncbi:MAG: hypothetical protein ABEJ42_05320 [Halobacteriaceae archaeon]